MKNFFAHFQRISILLLIFQATTNAEIIDPSICSGSCPPLSLCTNPCDVAWATGSFVTNGRQPIQINGRGFTVQRIAQGLYSVMFKKPFCCPISVVASSNIAQPIPTPRPTPTGFCVPKFLETFDTGSDNIAIAVSADEKCVAIAQSPPSQISVFAPTACGDFTTTASDSPHSLTDINSLTQIAYSANGCLAAVTSTSNNNVSIFPPSNSLCGLGAPVTTLISTNPTSLNLAFTPSGSCLAISSRKENVINFFKVINTCNLQMAPIPIPVTNPSKLAFSADGACLAAINGTSGTSNNILSVYSKIDTPQCIFSNVPVTSFTGNSQSHFTSIAFSPDNCLALLDSGNKLIHIFKDCSLTTIGGPVSLPSEITGSSSLEFSPDGNCLAVLTTKTGFKSFLTMYNVNKQSCTLTPTPGSPFDLGFATSNSTPMKFLSNECLAILDGTKIHVFTLSSSLQNSVVEPSQEFGVSPNRATSTQICEAITPGCFLIQLPHEADACATVTFFATPCT